MGLGPSSEKNAGGKRKAVPLEQHGVTQLSSEPSKSAHSSAVNIQVSPTNSVESKTAVPMVFTWQHGGEEVYVTGTFNNWQERIPLHKSEKDFTLIFDLQPGTYQYKFIVDGKWKHALDQAVTMDAIGNVNNYLEVKKPDTLTGDAPLSSSPHGTYGHVNPRREYYQGKVPPSMPPHLLHALLNTQPQPDDPSLLPLPHHVMINHLYSAHGSSADAEVEIFGVTHRYREKFITTVFYHPSPTAAQRSGVPEHTSPLVAWD
mmetsp:Transcript_36843/g.92338  ORF Transcript_36843/g.92338 Transcript_36843/m.92338 type:complete len:260 (-) Transcript_36843:232-1011(-)|eukprot:CAMPEP_0177687610 /NCGR_PEP_ID=MMETSP0447-20121125/34218_1 /TAXON_ID=0 /ORGANISM="Stygamoeba regulata, Strain BSH-02190019" /LENGTH=259 /DNA_ID=CAMNT_0019197859 /DNA_START=261 /DNA_END=1040 /DNA_ORIENTATION=-